MRKGMVVPSCIFCGTEGNLSEEHIWPQWMHPYLPAEDQITHVREYKNIHRYGRGESVIRPLKTYQGTLANRRLKIVCQNCNNEWMNRLEQTARPLIFPLITGRFLILEQAEITILAAWFAMKVMVGEFTWRENRVVPPEDLTYLRERWEPPPSWQICIANHNAVDWALARKRWASSVAPPGAELGPAFNIQSTSMGMNRLYMRATSVSLPNLTPLTTRFPSGVRQLWPYAGNIAWPQRVLSEGEIKFLSEVLTRKHPSLLSNEKSYIGLEDTPNN